MVIFNKLWNSMPEIGDDDVYDFYNHQPSTIVLSGY